MHREHGLLRNPKGEHEGARMAINWYDRSQGRFCHSNQQEIV